MITSSAWGWSRSGRGTAPWPYPHQTHCFDPDGKLPSRDPLITSPPDNNRAYSHLHSAVYGSSKSAIKSYATYALRYSSVWRRRLKRPVSLIWKQILSRSSVPDFRSLCHRRSTVTSYSDVTTCHRDVTRS